MIINSYSVLSTIAVNNIWRFGLREAFGEFYCGE